MATKATPTTTEFSGFDRQAIQFLADLAEHNDRGWFHPRKADYERLLKEPLEALCRSLDLEFRARAIPLSADPVKSPFRIYRDVRFSKDKSPYKTHLAATFPWAGGTMAHAGGDPGSYFHFQPGQMFAGGGLWHPEPAQLAAWRHRVVSDGAAVHNAIDDKAFRKTFGEVGGGTLIRPPAGVPADHPDIRLLKLKDVTFGRQLADADVLSGDLVGILADTFVAAVPVMRLLASLGAQET